MKKLITFVMAAVMSVGLASCGSADSAYELYTNAVAAMEESSALESKVATNMVMSYGEESLEINSTINMKQIVHSESDVEILMDSATEAYGTSMSTSVYYKDGWYYMDANDSKAKMQLDLETVESMSGAEPLSFSDTAIISQDMSTVDNGTEVTIVLSADTIKEQLASQLSGMSELLSSMGEDAELTYSDVTITAKVDKDGNMATVGMQFTISVSVSGETVNMDTALTIEYIAFGDDVTIDAPADLDSYVEVDASSLYAQ